MLYPFLDLRIVGLLVAAFLLAGHGWALLDRSRVQSWLKAFPRSGFIGVVLITVAAVWAFALIAVMDLGEFSDYRRSILIVIPVGYALTIKYVDEFLAVRALGILLLLGAETLIEAAFLQPETSRLLLVALAYAWATFGMYFVGMPYLLRDQIGWLSKTDSRWRLACLAGIGYGVAVLVCAVAFYH